MKKLQTGKLLMAMLIGVAILGLSTCKASGNGPVTVSGSYPGYFSLNVTIDGPDGVEDQIVSPTPYLTYQGDFYPDKTMWGVWVYAYKLPHGLPPDIPEQGDLGDLVVTISGDFGQVTGTQRLGDCSPDGTINFITVGHVWRYH